MEPEAYRAALDSVFAQSAYSWPDVRPEPVAPWIARILRWLTELWHWIRGLFPEGSEATAPIQWLLVVAGVMLLVHAAFRAGGAGRRARELDAARQAASAAPVRDAGWYFREAEALASLGRFGEAMLAAFHGAMLTLEARGRLRAAPGRTPRELVRLADLPPSAREELGHLVGAMYRAAFAQEPVEPAAFQAWLTSLRGLTANPTHAPAH
jgi:hypothetical protein